MIQFSPIDTYLNYVKITFLLTLLIYFPITTITPTVIAAGAPPGGPITLCDSTPYIVNGSSATGSPLYKINTSTTPFNFTQISPPGSPFVNAMAYNYKDGYFYAMAQQSPRNRIFQIDKNGIFTNITSVLSPIPLANGPTNAAYNIATIDENGIMYMTSAGNGPTPASNYSATRFTRLDLNTGISTVINLSTPLTTGDWAINPIDGFLYANNYIDGIIYKINPTTGIVSPVVTMSGTFPALLANTGGLWFNASGEMFIYENIGKIYKLKPTVSGITTLVSSATAGLGVDAGICTYTPTFKKTVNPTIVRSGDTVTYTYSITNGLPAPFTASFNDVLLDGRVFVGSSVSQTGFTLNGTLNNYTNTNTLQITNYTIPPLSTAIISVNVLVSGSQASGIITNQASLTNLPASFGTVNSDFTTSNIIGDPTPLTIVTPSVELDKTSTYNDLNSNGYGDAGETISYQFTVKNTGDVPLFNINITDNFASVSGNPLANLAVGAIDSTTFTGTYTITNIDIQNETVTNIATVNSLTSHGFNVTDISNDPITLAVNDPTITKIPLYAKDDEKSITANTTITYNPLENDVIPTGSVINKINGSTITVNSPFQITNGTIILNTDGTITVIPNSGYTGTIQFNYTILTPQNQEKVATNIISVTAIIQDIIQETISISPTIKDIILIRTGGYVKL